MTFEQLRSECHVYEVGLDVERGEQNIFHIGGEEANVDPFMCVGEHRRCAVVMFQPCSYHGVHRQCGYSKEVRNFVVEK